MAVKIAIRRGRKFPFAVIIVVGPMEKEVVGVSSAWGKRGAKDGNKTSDRVDGRERDGGVGQAVRSMRLNRVAFATQCRFIVKQ